jgi:hypothetical protein
MGTWGTAIFSDDLALDIKLKFRNKISSGKTPREATKELLEEYNEEVNDFDESSVFWFALASTQWSLGRLLENVKQKALEIIENGQDIERWNENKKDFNKRVKVLEKLKYQLQSEQPEPKKIVKQFVRSTKMEKGDLLSYNLANDKYVILRVIEIAEDQSGDRYPLIELLNYFNTSVPKLSELYKLDTKIIDNEGVDDGVLKIEPSGQFYLAQYGKRDNEPWDRLNILTKETKVKVKNGIEQLYRWRDFDNLLIEVFSKE